MGLWCVSESICSINSACTTYALAIWQHGLFLAKKNDQMNNRDGEIWGMKIAETDSSKNEKCDKMPAITSNSASFHDKIQYKKWLYLSVFALRLRLSGWLPLPCLCQCSCSWSAFKPEIQSAPTRMSLHHPPHPPSLAWCSVYTTSNVIGGKLASGPLIARLVTFGRGAIENTDAWWQNPNMDQYPLTSKT